MIVGVFFGIKSWFMKLKCLLLTTALGVVSCKDRQLEAPASSVSELVDDAGVEDAGALPAQVALFVTASLRDGGSVSIEPEALVDPSINSLTVQLSVPLSDFRLRLLDHRDQVVPSDDELFPDGKTYLIVPLEPLKTGRSYSVIMDSEFGPVVTNEQGQPLDDWSLVFRISGEIQSEALPAKKTRKKR